MQYFCLLDNMNFTSLKLLIACCIIIVIRIPNKNGVENYERYFQKWTEYYAIKGHVTTSASQCFHWYSVDFYLEGF